MKFDEKVWIPSTEKFSFRESIDPKTGTKSYKMRGLMLPFETVSRNNVLYNKGSVIDKHKDLIGRPLMYNHQVDARNDLPFGHFTDSICMDSPESGWENVFTKPGWYYEADVDPSEKDIIRKLERGDLRHVSIQLIGDSVEEKFDGNGNEYTEAWVGDIIEGSIVPAPGFLDTTAAFAEKLGNKIKEEVSTTTADGVIKPTQKLEALSPCQAWLKGLDHAPTDDEVHDWAEQNGKDVHEVEAQIYKLAKMHVDTMSEFVQPAKEEDVNPEQLKMGIKVEMEHTDDPKKAKVIALQHLAEVPDYYTKLKKYVEGLEYVESIIGLFDKQEDAERYLDVFKEAILVHTEEGNWAVATPKKERCGSQPTQPLMEEDEEEKVIQEILKIGEKKIKEILNE